MTRLGLWSIVVFLALVVVVVAIAFRHDQEWKENCKRDGYRVVDVYRGTLCVTDDGRVMRSL